jgi:hypothetical protein
MHALAGAIDTTRERERDPWEEDEDGWTRGKLARDFFFFRKEQRHTVDRKKKMANTRIETDLCYQQYRDSSNQESAAYGMYPAAYTRQGRLPSNTTGLSLANPSFTVGYSTPKTIQQESWLQGRGQPLSKCGENEVIQLPNELFSGAKSTECHRADLQPFNSRDDGHDVAIQEMDQSRWNLFPDGYQKGYQGYNKMNLVGVNSRQLEKENAGVMDAAYRWDYEAAGSASTHLPTDGTFSYQGRSTAVYF